ncbi:MAG: SET domain-containing methyltransferase [Solirubrobacteraceae bacterium]
MPHLRTSELPDATASRGSKSSVLVEQEASTTHLPEEEGVELLRTADGKGEGVLATRPFVAGETVMIGFLVGPLTGNNSHATQVGPGRWALHGGLGPKVNHSCDPNCGVRLNDEQAFDFVARRPISAGQELTFDYAMRNFTIDHFPATCLCGSSRCRGSVTGWKDLPANRKADYGELVAPYLHVMDDDIRQAASSRATQEPVRQHLCH